MATELPVPTLESRPELKAWERMGDLDPLWAIVSRPEMKGRRWNVDDFFRTGQERIVEIYRRIPSLGRRPEGGRALDFGCGVGRLTQALAPRFDEVVGVDGARSMVREAERLNRNPTRCRFVYSASDDLATFPSGRFDLVLADIVLQHIRPRTALRFVREFVRLLAPEGLAVFQLPFGPHSRWIKWVPARVSDTLFNSGRNFARRFERSDTPGWESHWVDGSRVRAAVESAGGRIRELLEEPPIHGKLENRIYVASRGG